MDISELLLKTAFCCMACDGEIADDEVKLLNKLAEESKLFGSLDVQNKIDEYVKDINMCGTLFLEGFLSEVATSNISDEQAIDLISLAIKTIEADQNIEYSEVYFVKKIRRRLNVSDEQILAKLPDKEDYLLSDIEVPTSFDYKIPFKQVILKY